MIKYKKIPGSKISFDIIITEEVFKASQKKVIQNLKENAEIKGFRKGQAPDNLVIGQKGAEEILMKTIDLSFNKEYRAFIIENDFSPISNPSLKVGDVNKMPVKISVEVEIFPEVTLGDYKKIKTEKISVEVTESEIQDLIETMIAEIGAGISVRRAAKKKDQVIVSIVGKNKEGKIFPQTKKEKIPFRLGFGHFFPDIEKEVEGMKPGEQKTKIALNPSKKHLIKGISEEESVFFDLHLHEIKEIKGDSIDKDTIEKIVGKKKSIEVFKKDIKNFIIRNKKNQKREASIKKYETDLLKYVTVDIPVSWVNEEVAQRMKEIKSSPEYVANPEKFWASIKQDEKTLEKKFSMEAERGIKKFLGLSKIIKEENTKLEEDEIKILHQKVSQGISNNNSKKEYSTIFKKEELAFKINKFLNNLFS